MLMFLAGAGKSTIARGLAKELNASFLDTGATYRAVTLAIMTDRDASFNDADSMVSCARKADIKLIPQEGTGTKVFLDGKDVSDDIRSVEISSNVRYPANNPLVRVVLVELQRKVASDLGNVVTEGRDQGSVVFPDADFKFYLDASVEVRADRRLKELVEMKEAGKVSEVPSRDELQKQIADRDHSDMSRSMGPLCIPENAITIDSSTMSIPEVVESMLNKIKDN